MSKSKQSKSMEVISETETPAVMSEQQIAGRAYALYLARGADDGHDLDDWLQAERQLRNQIRDRGSIKSNDLPDF